MRKRQADRQRIFPQHFRFCSLEREFNLFLKIQWCHWRDTVILFPSKKIIHKYIILYINLGDVICASSSQWINNIFYTQYLQQFYKSEQIQFSFTMWPSYVLANKLFPIFFFAATTLKLSSIICMDFSKRESLPYIVSVKYEFLIYDTVYKFL